MKKRNYSSRPELLLLLAAGVLYSLMALSDNIWADEAYTMAMLPHSFREIWTITAADVHPPLYYFAAKLVSMPFGYSQYVVRLFSAGCFFAILAVGGKELSRLFSRKIGLLFMVLFLLYPFCVDFAIQARMYGLASLAVFLCALFAYRAWLENRVMDWVGFTAAGLCAAYSHYFALVAAGVIYGLLFLCCLCRRRKLLKPWFIASLVTVVLYLPWLKCFLQQLAYKVNNEYWIAPLTLSGMISEAIALVHADGFSVFPLFFVLLGLGLLIRLVRDRAAAPLLALVVPMLTMVLGVGISLLIRPIFIFRYLAPCGALIVFFLAYGVGTIRKETLYGGAVAVLLTAFSANLIFTIWDILPAPNKFGTAAAAQAEEAQAYVILTDTQFHMSQAASYYEPETPIYTQETLGDASPYPNIYLLEEFSPAGLDCFAVFTNKDAAPDDSLCQGFQAKNLGTYSLGNDLFDFWLLERDK